MNEIKMVAGNNKYDSNWLEKFSSLFTEGLIWPDSYLGISLIPTITLYLPFSEQEIPIFRKSKNEISKIPTVEGKELRPEETARLFFEKNGLNAIRGEEIGGFLYHSLFHDWWLTMENYAGQLSKEVKEKSFHQWIKEKTGQDKINIEFLSKISSKTKSSPVVKALSAVDEQHLDNLVRMLSKGRWSYGIPDLFVYSRDIWFFTEVKRYGDSLHRSQYQWLSAFHCYVGNQFVLTHIFPKHLVYGNEKPQNFITREPFVKEDADFSLNRRNILRK